MEGRGQEKRWYQKPEFIWTICVFVLLQVAGQWKSSNDRAAQEAVRNRGIDELKSSFDDFRTKAFAEFQTEVRQRFQNQEARNAEWQTEQRRTWQIEHDANADTKSLAEQVASGLREFKDDYKRQKEQQDMLILTARERIGKLEAKP